MARALATLIALTASLGVFALTGQVVGTTGTSQGARFGVTGATLPLNQTPATGAQYSVSALVSAPVARPDNIFHNGFE